VPSISRSTGPSAAPPPFTHSGAGPAGPEHADFLSRSAGRRGPQASDGTEPTLSSIRQPVSGPPEAAGPSLRALLALALRIALAPAATPSEPEGNRLDWGLETRLALYPWSPAGTRRRAVRLGMGARAASRPRSARRDWLSAACSDAGGPMPPHISASKGVHAVQGRAPPAPAAAAAAARLATHLGATGLVASPGRGTV
jgi:hypothetical protein